MKKLTAILFSALLLLSLVACGNSNQNIVEDTSAEMEVGASVTEPEDGSTESTEENAVGGAGTSGTAESGGSNVLIAYFPLWKRMVWIPCLVQAAWQ